jgi:hypothetical protein
LKMQEKMGDAWVLVSRNVWPPHTPPRTATIDGGSTMKDPLKKFGIQSSALPCALCSSQ